MSIYTPKVSQDNRPVFVSLGMVVLDELRFPHHHTVFDVPGGSGFYATLGARLFKANPQAVDVGCIVAAGYDLPKSLLHLLHSWQMTLLLLHVADKPCTRGLLQYEDDAFGRKTFSYVNPPLRPSTIQLGTSSLLCAASFHFLALPDDLESEVSTLLRLREEQGIMERPLIIWEPAPMGCDSVHLTSHLKACALVDVFSPNHLELGHLVEGESKSEAEFSPSVIEAHARRFLEAGIGPNQKGCAVIRSGEYGVLTLCNNKLAEWLPAYYDKGSDKVVDPTGAGNTFLGAFAVGLQETNDPREASLRGSVAASYVLEQFGPPKLTDSSSFSGELWNGSDVLSRLQDFKTRISKA